MKKLSLLFLLGILISKIATAQNYNNILNYNLNGTPDHGVKIKTNLPFVPDGGMPTITIKGYNYGESETVDLTLVYYVWWQTTNTPSNYYFHSTSLSSSGGYTPEVSLSHEDGKVVIFINDKTYFLRFTVNAYSQGVNEVSSWFEGWTAVDEPLTGDRTIEVPYLNKFKGRVFMPGESLWNSNGDVGIGTATPLTKVDIMSNTYLPVQPGLSRGTIHIRPSENSTDQLTGITFSANQSSLTTGQAGIYVQSSGAYGTKMHFGTTDNYAEGAKKRMTIDHLGNIGIGTTEPKGYKLAVAGNMIAESIKVKSQSEWPDFIFAKSYQLPTLQETEKYIKEKGHLPGIPSAKEVKTNGIDLGEMNARLLQKIEELTLHLIENDKEIKRLKKANIKAAELSLKIEKLINK